MTVWRTARAQAAATRVAPILDPSQETRVATFFNESLFFDTVFVKNPLRTQKLILFSGTEPELMQRMQMIFRRRRAELRAARII